MKDWKNTKEKAIWKKNNLQRNCWWQNHPKPLMHNPTLEYANINNLRFSSLQLSRELFLWEGKDQDAQESWLKNTFAVLAAILCI